jgi:hypothetical protein
MTVRTQAIALLPLLLAACDSSPPQPTDTGTPLPLETRGAFLCSSAALGTGLQIVASKDVPAGGDAELTVTAPPSSTAAKRPSSAIVHCQVDVDWCTGSLCRAHPQVDFVGKNGDGTTWKQVTVDGEPRSASFTAKVHNGDSDAHTVRLVLEMPSGWKPGPGDGQ